MSAEYAGHTQPVVIVNSAGTELGPVAAASGAPTDRSGTIAAGATAQTAAAALTTRRYLLIENLSTTEDLWFNFGTTAVASQPSILLAAGKSWENPPHFCPTGLVSVIAATTGHAFTCKEA